MSTLTRRLAGVSSAALASALLLVPAQAEAAAPTCHASMSDATPSQYSNVGVRVSSVANARVRTIAHYKTTDTTHYGRTGPAGRATIGYYISSATAGYRVIVNVMVTGPAGAHGYCTTSFVPHS